MLFTYTISHKKDVYVINIEGELIDKNQAEPFVQEIKKLVDAGNKKYVLDFSNLRYMNSSGLGVLISVLTKIRNSDGELSVTNLNKKIKELLVITKLNQMFHVTDTLEKAIESLSKNSS